jgi:quercetin dioxygenase-like cupin family protein
MRRISHKIAVALLLALVGGGVYVANVLATPANGLTQVVKGPYSFAPFDVRVQSMPPAWRVHLRTDGQSDVYSVDNVFAPGASTGWHSHPGPSFILVVSGTVTNYEGGDGHCSITQYSAGSGFMDEGGNDIHMIKNNTSEPAETIALQVLPQGATRRIDEPDPGTCPGQ